MEDNLATALVSLTLDISRSLRQEISHGCRKGVGNLLQLHALAFIEEHPGITMKAFSQALHVSSPSATTFIDRLVKAGWVKRLFNPKNRKLVLLSLTPMGKRMLSKNRAEKRAVIHGLISCIPSKDQRHLLQILNRLLNEIQRSSQIA
ncbi:MAG: MarR family transcriptional regulator [Candidatus Peribacteraceae bacterium]|nr:MarR family transcriptional regulator [Candidatus Peribacteraceae bacterium]